MLSECDWDNGEINCPNGLDVNKCWLGDYCMPGTTPDGCVNICAMPCTVDEVACDNGMDANGCWLGNTCIGKHLLHKTCMLYDI